MGLTAPIHDVLGAVGSSSLAASIFIAFTFCASPVSHPKRMILSYFIAIVLGACGYKLGMAIGIHDKMLSYMLTFQIIGGLVVGLTMLMMVLFNLHHPPAAGLALGLVIEHWRISTLFVIIGTILLVSLMKHLLRHRLVSLL